LASAVSFDLLQNPPPPKYLSISDPHFTNVVLVQKKKSITKTRFMKPLIVALFAMTGLVANAQKKYHATILDIDNNIVARGLFQTVNDSSLTVLVENVPVDISYSDINVLKIEKNGSGIEFSKLGSSLATGLIDGATTTSSSDSTADSTKSKPIISQENKRALLKKADMLLQQLLDGMDDVAAVTISGSLEKFSSKSKLMREYSFDEEPGPKKKPATSTPTVMVMVKPAVPKTKSPAVGSVVAISLPARPATVTVPTKSGNKQAKGVPISARNINKH
jgi:hypothetical protein